MGCGPSSASSSDRDFPKASGRMSSNHSSRRTRHGEASVADKEDTASSFMKGDKSSVIIEKDVPLDTIIAKFRVPPFLKAMDEMRGKNDIFTIKPEQHNQSRRRIQPISIDDDNTYDDIWDENHVRMPCSKYFMNRNKKPMWPKIQQQLWTLKGKCESHQVQFRDLQQTIEFCNERSFDMACLQYLIDRIFSNTEFHAFMYDTLPKMCDLVLKLPATCVRPLPLLRQRVDCSVTISQQQAASLLACAFFCLFPFRDRRSSTREYEFYQNPNFEPLYERGPDSKIEKLKCILHYFKRVTKEIPTGVITFQRVVLRRSGFPMWNELKTNLCDLNLTTGRKIEDIDNVLQVDFANKYIGGGVLGAGCVQEEIRFSICPEMLVSLLICEMMEDNECIFLIGCERYSSYRGYAHSFQFDGNYHDTTPRDSWGRKWCHVVAMDAIYFRKPASQYHMKVIERELNKAYIGFRPLEEDPSFKFGIATGNWGCGAFNGDRQLKAIIQLMAASLAGRPLIYAAFGDKKLVTSFSAVYDCLKKQEVTVGDLYYYLFRYCRNQPESTLFDYILDVPVTAFRN